MSDVIELPLSQGYVAIIDACDAHLAEFKWSAAVRSNTVYAQRGVYVDGKRTITLLHQEVIGKAPLGFVIDHEDGNGLNCRRGNLRHVTQAVNMMNKGRMSGVVKHCKSTGWTASLGRGKYLGYFKTREEAVEARLRAEREQWGIQPQRKHLHSA